MDTFRDSFAGHLTRTIFRRKVLLYPEEKDPSGWERRYTQPTKPELASKESSDGSAILSREQTGGSNALSRSATRAAQYEPWLSTLVSQATSDERRREITRSNTRTTQNNGVVDVEKPRDYAIVDFFENDPANPQNWSLAKKVLVSGVICLLTFSIYIGSAIYTPGIPGIAEEFRVSPVAATLGLTLFVAGYAVGPMIWSPLSEVPPIGRSPVYTITLFVFVLLQLAVVMPANFGMLMAFRFITGFVGSPALATGGASMCDIWAPNRRSFAIGIWGAVAICAPTLGPTVGGFAFDAEGWTWTIWELMWLSGFTLVVILLGLPETSAANILYRRAGRLRNLTGNQSLKSQSQIETEGLKIKDLTFEALVRPFMLAFQEPIVLCLNIYTALVYGILYLFFEAFPIVFMEIHGFNSGENGLAFLGLLVGTLVTVVGYFAWMYYVRDKYYDENGDIAPERQLPPACIGAFALPIALFWFGWTSTHSIHWIVPIISTSFFSVGGCLIFNCSFSYLSDAYPKYAASTLAGNDFFRSMYGAGFPLFASAMFHNLGVGKACSVLGCLTIVFIPIPFVLLKYGERIRKASKYARHDI